MFHMLLVLRLCVPISILNKLYIDFVNANMVGLNKQRRRQRKKNEKQ